MNKKIEMAIIGSGAAANFHARAFKECDNVVCAGVFSENKGQLEEFSQKYNFQIYNSFDDVLNDDKLNTVNICTPSGLHAEIAEKALLSGKNVIIEKPLALNLSDCDRVICAEKKSGKIGTVISGQRFSDESLYLKKALDEKSLGKPICANAIMTYYRTKEYYSESPWRGTWQLDGGGALMNQGIHGIDLLRFLMGEVRAVSAFTKTLVHDIEVEDSAVAILEFCSGALGIIEGTTSSYPGYPLHIDVCGSLGSASIEDGKVLRWDVGKEAPKENDDLHTSGASNPESISISGHAKQISNFADAILNNKRVEYTILEAKKTIELVLAIYESSKTGKKIILNER